MGSLKTITINKDIFLEQEFCEVIFRMGWDIKEVENNWVITLPGKDLPLFDFVFGV